MQIHEITHSRLDEGVGSFVGGLAGGASNIAKKVVGAISPGDDAKSAYASAVRPQQIQMLADKVYTGWKQYEKTLLQSNPDARTSGMYEQALLAFVTKNLLGGQYLPNVINRRQIEALVKQLSGSASVTEADEITGAVKSGLPTPAERAKLQQQIAATDKSSQAKAGSTPPPGGAQASPAGKPAQPKPATLTPQQEKDLWLKLTQQAVVATTQAPGTRTGATKSAADDPVDDNTAGDARSYAGQMQADAKIQPLLNQLAQIGPTYGQTVGSQRVKSTGNPAADALLLLARFQGI